MYVIEPLIRKILYYKYYYTSISNIRVGHLAFEKKKFHPRQLIMSYPFMRKKNFCPRRSYHVLPISKNGSFYIGKSKTFIKNFQDIPRYIIPSHLSWPKISRTFTYIFLKFLSKMLLSCPTLISGIEEYISNCFLPKSKYLWMFVLKIFVISLNICTKIFGSKQNHNLVPIANISWRIEN